MAIEKRRPTPTAATTFAPAVSRALAALEQTFGGRDGLITLLACAPHDDRLDYVLNLLADPLAADRPLADCCALGNVSPGELLQHLKAGSVLYTQALSARHLPAHVPQAVEDVLTIAHVHEGVCDACLGVGTIMIVPSRRRRSKSRADDAVEDGPRTESCRDCAGTGVKTYPADPDARAIALELAGLLKAASPLALSFVSQQVVDLGPGGGRIERFQQAVAAALDVESASPSEDPLAADAPSS